VSTESASAARNILWIASYPKSGNTWVRFLVCNLLFGPQHSAAALNGMAPDIHEWGAERLLDHSGLVKTHFCYSPTLPLLQRTAAAIYVVRQPADVMLSNFRYGERATAAVTSSSAAFAGYVQRFLQHRGDPHWIERGMGSWEQNVRSWLEPRAGLRVLLVRYEDLQRNPRQIAGQMLQMLGAQRSAEQIDAAVRGSTFEAMQAIEAADIRERRIGIFYKPYLQGAIDSGRRFMRNGTVGEAKRWLSETQQAQVTEVFGPTLRQLGYTS
jgi:hypothetical protein